MPTMMNSTPQDTQAIIDRQRMVAEALRGAPQQQAAPAKSSGNMLQSLIGGGLNLYGAMNPSAPKIQSGNNLGESIANSYDAAPVGWGTP